MAITECHCMILKNGKISADHEGLRDFGNFFQNLASQPERGPLVLHFHGGLVSREHGLKIAKNLTSSCYGPAGAQSVFFVWESHPLETIRNNLGEIAGEPLFRLILKHVSQFAKAKIEEKYNTRGQRLELPSDATVWDEIDLLQQEKLPFSSIDTTALSPSASLSSEQSDQFEERLRSDNRFNIETQKIAAALLPGNQADTRSGRIKASTTTLMSPSVLDEIRREAATPEDRGILSTARIIKGSLTILKNVIVRFAGRRDHGFFPTIVEEVLRELYLANAGTFIWDLMKKDTQDAFEGFGTADANLYGGTEFLRQLSLAWTEGCRPRIVLVGHSTGAIFICNLLKASDDQGLPADIRFDTIFSAPAVRFDLFADTLVHHADRIRGFRTFGMSDELEQSDKLLGILYPRSLLYLVSGILEREVDCPLVGMQRYYSKTNHFDQDSNSSIKRVIDYLDADRNRSVWSSSDRGPGLSSRSIRHGDFDNDPATLSSLQTILQRGF